MPNMFAGRLVRLRVLEPEDAEIIHRHLQDTEIARRDSRIHWPRSLATIRRRLEPAADAAPTDDQDLAIETLDGRLVGGIDVQSSNSRNGTFSVGLGLGDRADMGKGYAKEAMLLILRHMFHERRYQKCNISVYAFNARALNLYRHLGFQDEGRVRRNYYSNGAYHDEIFLGMTGEEFDARYPDWHLAIDDAAEAA
jgi:RimJ/RimL family protein N-acetyltransferase